MKRIFDLGDDRTLEIEFLGPDSIHAWHTCLWVKGNSPTGVLGIGSFEIYPNGEGTCWGSCPGCMLEFRVTFDAQASEEERLDDITKQLTAVEASPRATLVSG